MILVVAGALARSMFSAFGFGPPDAIDTEEAREYLKLPFMVLGAVLAGWSFMMLQIVRGPLRSGDTWALPVLTRSLVLWFVVDTGMSFVLGHPTHAIFNVPIGIALAIPLIRLRRA